jgi:hypothetical protein
MTRKQYSELERLLARLITLRIAVQRGADRDLVYEAEKALTTAVQCIVPKR